MERVDDYGLSKALVLDDSADPNPSACSVMTVPAALREGSGRSVKQLSTHLRPFTLQMALLYNQKSFFPDN